MADDENQPDLYDGAEPEARPVRPRVDGAPPEVGEDARLEALLAYLKRTRGFDFTGYKRASLSRRVRKRMDEVGVEDFATYEDFLEVHPGEFGALFNTVLINVTCFFRDPESWAYLRQEVIPRLIARKAPDAPIRAWSAGCAAGDGAYARAIALAEARGPEQLRARV
jgi:two-component system CheB/CheR fusion protein